MPGKHEDISEKCFQLGKDQETSLYLDFLDSFNPPTAAICVAKQMIRPDGGLMAGREKLAMIRSAMSEFNFDDVTASLNIEWLLLKGVLIESDKNVPHFKGNKKLITVVEVNMFHEVYQELLDDYKEQLEEQVEE